MKSGRSILIWAGLGAAVGLPIAAAAASPLLAWRAPVYILAGFAGVVALALLLIQPLLIGGYLPGVSPAHARRSHRFVGGALVLSLVVHVGGLWLSSPPDVIDALLFASPTPFSAWGVIAMWATFAAALFAAVRHRMGVQPRTWRIGHTGLALVIVVGSIVHAVLIEGTMETMSKAALCALVFAATLKVLIDRRVWTRRPTTR